MPLSYIISNQQVRGVRYDPWNAPGVITIWEEQTGGTFRASERSLSAWRTMLEYYNALWFMPFLERLAAGETVGVEELDACHTRLFGVPMERKEIQWTPRGKS